MADYVPPKPGAFQPKPGAFEAFSSIAPRPQVPDAKEEVARVYRNPVKGTAKALVIMMDFTDVHFDPLHDQTYWQHMLFDTSNPWSLASYYREASNGQFSVTGTIIGPVQSDHPMDYYGADSATGLDDANGSIGEMIREAVQKADGLVNFRDFDQTDLADVDHDGITNEADGTVDHIILIHAGPGQEGGGGTYVTNAIWSHRGYVYPVETVDGVRVSGYTTEPDDGEMGVFAHEFGHDIGLPDLYDVAQLTEGVGEWDLMGTGSWSYVWPDAPGTRPAMLGAWARSKLGWLTPTTVTADSTGLVVPASVYAPVAYRLDVPGENPNEYYLLENRQLAGFDAGLPGHGLLIWHIDDSIATPDNTDNSSRVVHPRVYLAQADGNRDLELTPNNRGDGGDPFPGTSGNSEFSDLTDPNARAYSGVNSHIRVHNIAEVPNALLGVNDILMDIDVTNRTDIDSVTADNPRFSPNGDGYRDSVTATVTTTEAATVSVAVYDSTGVFVAPALDSNGKTSATFVGSHAFTWDGLNGTSPLTDGDYTMVVKAVYGLTTYTNQIDVRLDMRAPVVTDLAVDPSTVTDASTASVVSFTFTAGDNRGGSYTFRVLDHGIPRETGNWPIFHDGFQRLYWWATVDDSGQPYTNGTYTISIVATDGANGAAEVTRDVIVNLPVVSPPSGGGSGAPTTNSDVTGKQEKGTVDPGGGRLELFDGNVAIVAEADTVQTATEVTASIRPKDSFHLSASWLGFVSDVYEISAGGAKFDKPITLVLRYQDSTLQGEDADKLGIYYLNPTSNTWEYVGGKVDKTAKTVSAKLSHFSKYALLMNTRTFSDLTNHWAKKNVELLASKNTVQGNTAGLFGPDSPITRAEFATMLARALGLTSERPAEATFVDVPSSAWYYSSVEALAKAGVVTGYEGRFRPDASISRQEMMVMMVRALGKEAEAKSLTNQDTASALKFDDAESVSDFARGSATVAVREGLVTGDPAGNLLPANPSSRAEAATMILRLMQKLGII